MRGSKPKDEHVKKPSNAFMLYRSEKVAEIVEQYPEYKKEQARLSKVVGQIWQEEPDDVKARFIEMAREEKRVFELANPGFKYGPNPEKARRRAEAAAKAQAKAEAAAVAPAAKVRRKRRGIKRNADSQEPADELRRGSFDELVEAAAMLPFEPTIERLVAQAPEHKVARHLSPPVALERLETETKARAATHTPSGPANAVRLQLSPEAAEHAVFMTHSVSGLVTRHGLSTQVLPLQGLGEGYYVVVQAGPPESPICLSIPAGTAVTVDVIKQEPPASPAAGSFGATPSGLVVPALSDGETSAAPSRGVQHHDWMATVLGPSEPNGYDDDEEMEYESEDD